jgi:hypothetical protein
MDPHLSLIDLGEENGVEVDRPDSIVDLLQPDELLLQGIGDEEQLVLEPEGPSVRHAFDDVMPRVLDRRQALIEAQLVEKCLTEMENAPSRGSVGKSYLIASHDGIPSTGDSTKRHEEHLALAVFNHYQPPNAGLHLADGDELHILEYQLPLKAKRGDAGVGKVDLFGITTSGQPVVIELKAAGGGDTPLRALLEGLAYAAIIQANLAAIRREVQQRYSRTITADVPRLIIMAQEDWAKYRARLAAEECGRQLQMVADRILQGMGVQVDFVALQNATFVHGRRGTRPVLDSAVTCVPAFQRAA